MYIKLMNILIYLSVESYVKQPMFSIDIREERKVSDLASWQTRGTTNAVHRMK